MSPAANTVQLAPKMTGLALALVGAVFLAISSIVIVMTQRFTTVARRAEATVVSLYAGPSHPKIEFIGPTGEKFEFYGSGWTSHRVGDGVHVLFLDSDPEASARLDEPGSIWFLPSMFALLGGGALVVGLLVVLRRKEKSEL
jgi:hypothetical protein